MKNFISKNYLNKVYLNFKSIEEIRDEISEAINVCLKSIKRKNKIIFCGNGGSAADSLHLSAELVGKFLKKRKSIPSISLASNTSILTSLSNDFSYKIIFKRQLESLGLKGDVLFAISTSGKSENVNLAVKYALSKKMSVIYLTSIKCNMKKRKNLHFIKVKANRVDRIQEQHIAIGHIICEFLENSC